MADKEKKNKQSFFQKLRNKYKLIVINEKTFEERFTFRLSRLNVFIVIGTISILLVVATIYIIAFTPLREYIPGYTNVKMQKNLYNLVLKTDSLQIELNRRDFYIEIIKNAMEGKSISNIDANFTNSENKNNYDSISLTKSVEDSLLREEFENLDKFNLLYSDEETGAAFSSSSISSYFFFTPLKGKIINGFNLKNKHYGIDIIGKENDVIKATLDGTVIFSTWTFETGYIICIQHQANIISVYKHNSALLKSEGNFVKAGESIAILGNSGKLTTGPHLHFELWYNGNPVNPADYMTF